MKPITMNKKDVLIIREFEEGILLFAKRKKSKIDFVVQEGKEKIVLSYYLSINEMIPWNPDALYGIFRKNFFKMKGSK